MTSHVSKWSIPYLSLFNILTSDESLFHRKIYQLRGLIRIGLLEIISGLLQATAISTLYKSIQNLITLASITLAKGAAVDIITGKLYKQILIYLFALMGVAVLDLCTRYYRNYYLSQYAKKIPVFTKESTNEHTFQSKAAANQLKSERKGSSLTEMLRAQYLVSQGFIMGPLEIITYLCMLGPTLLAAIALLSAVSGYVKHTLNLRITRLRARQNEIEISVQRSEHNNHVKRVQENLDIRRKIKNIDVFGDYADIVIVYLAQVFIIIICSRFLFAGSYTLAQHTAQISAALTAFARILKYLKLMSSDNNLRSSFSDLTAINELKVFNENPNENQLDLINEVEAYKTMLELKSINLSNNLEDNNLLKQIKFAIKNGKCDLQHDSGENQLLLTTPLKALYKSLDCDNPVVDTVKLQLEQCMDLLNNDEHTEITDIIQEQNNSNKALYTNFSDYARPVWIYTIAAPLLIGLLLTPAPSITLLTAFIPNTTLKQSISLALLAYTGLFLYTRPHNGSTQIADGSLLAYCLKLAIFIPVTWYTYQLYMAATTVFLMENKFAIMGILATTYPVLSMFDQYCYQSLAFVCHFITISLAQIVVSFAQLPTLLSKNLPSMPSIDITEKSDKASPTSWFGSLLQFSPFHGNSVMHF